MAPMRLNPTPVPIELSDDEIRSAVADATVAPLLCAVAQLTGDQTILHDDLRPDMAKIFEPNAGYSDEQLAHGRVLAADALVRFRDAGSRPAPQPAGVELRRLIDFVGGATVADEYVPLLTEELAL